MIAIQSKTMHGFQKKIEDNNSAKISAANHSGDGIMLRGG